MNNVDLNPSLWKYTIHGRNAEIIHLLEEDHVIPEDKTFKSCFIESVKCHHNEIANYIKDNLLDLSIKDEEIYLIGIEYYNFDFIPTDLNNRSDEIYHSLISYDFTIARILLNDQINCFKFYNNCAQIKEIVIPPFITEIDQSSFNKCINLKQISIPSSITSIGNILFFTAAH